MSVSVSFTNLNGVIGDLQAYSANKQMQINNRIQLAGINVQTQAKRDCPVGTPESTHKKGYHGGRLRQSIQYKPGQMQCSVGSDVKYAIFVNDGTKKMTARPFLTNAFIGERPKLIQDLGDIVKS
jgi:HK97 gp10 family phage protein